MRGADGRGGRATILKPHNRPAASAQVLRSVWHGREQTFETTCEQSKCSQALHVASSKHFEQWSLQGSAGLSPLSSQALLPGGTGTFAAPAHTCIIGTFKRSSDQTSCRPSHYAEVRDSCARCHDYKQLITQLDSCMCRCSQCRASLQLGQPRATNCLPSARLLLV